MTDNFSESCKLFLFNKDKRFRDDYRKAVLKTKLKAILKLLEDQK